MYICICDTNIRALFPPSTESIDNSEIDSENDDDDTDNFLDDEDLDDENPDNGEDGEDDEEDLSNTDDSTSAVSPLRLALDSIELYSPGNHGIEESWQMPASVQRDKSHRQNMSA